MAESAQEVRVFVSSPRDVLPERGRVDAVAAKLNGEYEGLAQIKTVLWKRASQSQPRFSPRSGGSGLRYCRVHLLTTLARSYCRNLHTCRAATPGTVYELLTALEASKKRGVRMSMSSARQRTQRY